MPSAATATLAASSPARAFAIALASGVAHACAGPDHVAAVVALAARTRRRAIEDGDDGGAGGVARRCAIEGARWGVGHSMGLGGVTGVFYALGRAMDVETAALASDYVVGGAMCALGVASASGGWKMVMKRRKEREHVEDGEVEGAGEVETHARDGDETSVRVAAGSEAHEEAHALGVSHVHVREVDVESDDVVLERASLWKRVRRFGRDKTAPAYAVGFLHGVSGLSGVIYVLPAVFLTDETRVSLYLFGFFISSVISMTLFAAVLGALPHSVKMAIWMSLVGGALVFGVGLMWIILTAQGKLDL